MSIVALDTYPINPGDLSWQRVEALGNCTMYERTAPEEVYERVKEADAILTNKVALSAELFEKLPKLNYIGVMATGYNIVDVEAAHARGITVTNVPAYSTSSVAQLVFALLLELTHHAGAHSESVHAGRWATSKDFSYAVSPLIELSGGTFGIVGFGAIGKAVAQIARAFGMRVVASSRRKVEEEGVESVDLEKLFRESDVISLHCPLTPETKHLVDEERLALMKPSAFLINTSRGPIVDEAALALALDQGKIAGAGIDVVSTEPPSKENPLLSAKNCVITPHIGWATFAARTRLIDVIADNLRSYQEGAPVNAV